MTAFFFFDKAGSINVSRRPVHSLLACYLYQLAQLGFTGQAMIGSQTSGEKSVLVFGYLVVSTLWLEVRQASFS